MKKYKVCVYAICKNEEQFVERWMDSVEEADLVIVLDTGSTDKTVEKLEKRGVNVFVEIIKPWRFDVARNKSLSLIPEDYDICVCLDMDEKIEKGWRKKLEKIWDKRINRLSYNYNWSFDEKGRPAVNFYIEKIHDRKNYTWRHPVHEVLKYTGTGEEVKKVTDEITVNHYPDHTKPRSQYLPLLELAVKEDPEDDRNMHYLGREYMYKGQWNDAIDTLIKHLNLPRSLWKDERSASMRFISRCYINLKRYFEAQMWLQKAVIEAPHLREPYIELAYIEFNLENYVGAEILLKEALKIESRGKTYINELFAWDETIYDLLSRTLDKQGKYDEAIQYVNKAISINPDDKRLHKNKKIFIKNKKDS